MSYLDNPKPFVPCSPNPGVPEKYGRHDWLHKMLEDISYNMPINFEGRKVPKWAQQIIMEEIEAAKLRKEHCR